MEHIINNNNIKVYIYCRVGRSEQLDTKNT